MLHPRRLASALAIAVSAIMLVACSGGGGSLEDAAAELQVPDAFTETEAETLNGFEATTRDLRFTTDLSQNEACELARTTLEVWGDQAVTDESTALPLTLCIYRITNPANHPDVDVAVASVTRARVGGDFVEDADQPGGAGEVQIFFRNNK